MSTVRPLVWPQLLIRAVTAGVTAGVTLQIYLWLTILLPAHRGLLGYWQWIASALIGNVAFTGTGYAWLGLLVHFFVSITWAGGYAYLATQRDFLNRRWPISGPVYGLVVLIFMQVMLLGAGKFVFPTALGFANALVAHVVFFGLPVAYVVANLDRR
jgi:uncharacterized membrane protein YagU involved in acid resistance